MSTPLRSSHSSRAVLRLLVRWTLGGVAATVVMWIGSSFFVDSVTTLTWSPELGRYIHKPGVVRRVRTEGWADSRYGELDILGIEDAEASRGRCVIVWGDSFVEGSQVDDESKVANQLVRLLEPLEMGGVGVGLSGRAAVDVFFDLPKYEKLLDPSAHFIVLPGIEDVSPDEVAFRSTPELALVPRPEPKQFASVREIVANARAEFLFTAYQNLKGTGRGLRFAPGPVPPTVASSKAKPRAEALAASWRFLVRQMRERTDKPVTFVFAPNVPVIEAGRLVRSHGEEALVERFSEVCREQGVGFIDLTPRFLAFHEQTGQFPCGFANSQVSKGHWNADGHRLVAEAIAGRCEQLVRNEGRQGRRDVVHTD